MILFVDDEGRRVESYVDELRFAGFDVKHISNADEALEFVKANYRQIDLAIVDIMMPAGPAFDDVDTENGLRTGIRLYERIRTLSLNLPVAFLTNVAEDDVALRADSGFRYFVKRRYLPHEFAEEIRELLEAMKQ